jgi:hypothetical protein
MSAAFVTALRREVVAARRRRTVNRVVCLAILAAGVWILALRLFAGAMP